MFENMTRSIRIVGTATAVTLSIGLGAAVGVVPRLVDTPSFTASVSETAVAPVLSEPLIGTTVPTTVVPTTVAEPTTPPPTVKKASAPRARASAPVAVAPVTPAPAPAPALAPRTQPTSSEINQAIQGLRQYVLTLFAPSPAQVTQAGDLVCSAFDEGKTFAEVKAMGLAAVSRIPLVSVSAGAADYVVQTGVSLFCPAYQSKLV